MLVVERKKKRNFTQTSSHTKPTIKASTFDAVEMEATPLVKNKDRNVVPSTTSVNVQFASTVEFPTTSCNAEFWLEKANAWNWPVSRTKIEPATLIGTSWNSIAEEKTYLPATSTPHKRLALCIETPMFVLGSVTRPSNVVFCLFQRSRWC